MRLMRAPMETAMRSSDLALPALLCLFTAISSPGALAAWSESGGSSIGVEPAPKFKIDRKSGRGLCTVKGPINLLSAPKPGSKVIDTFPEGGIMTYIGNVPKSDYAYVHPCNACEYGYVSRPEFLGKISSCTR